MRTLMFIEHSCVVISTKGRNLSDCARGIFLPLIEMTERLISQLVQQYCFNKRASLDPAEAVGYDLSSLRKSNDGLLSGHGVPLFTAVRPKTRIKWNRQALFPDVATSLSDEGTIGSTGLQV